MSSMSGDFCFHHEVCLVVIYTVVYSVSWIRACLIVRLTRLSLFRRGPWTATSSPFSRSRRPSPPRAAAASAPGPTLLQLRVECPGLVHPALAGAVPPVMAGQVAAGALLCCSATTPNGPMTKGQTRRRRATCWPGHLELPGQGPFLPRGVQQQQSATPPRSAHVPKVENEVITSLPLVNIISAV
jgi:hypothetical protein